MAMFRQKEREQPKEQGGAVGDEYVTYEINSRKAQNLAEWLNAMDANGYELEALEGYGNNSNAYLMAVVRRKRR